MIPIGDGKTPAILFEIQAGNGRDIDHRPLTGIEVTAMALMAAPTVSTSQKRIHRHPRQAIVAQIFAAGICTDGL